MWYESLFFAVISIGTARGGIRSTDAEIAAPSTEKVAVSKKVPWIKLGVVGYDIALHVSPTDEILFFQFLLLLFHSTSFPPLVLLRYSF